MSCTEQPRRKQRSSRAEGVRLRRNRIIESAAWLLIHDPDKFSMRNLARKADLSVRTIYNIVGDQVAVLMAVVNRPPLNILEHVGDIDVSSPLERLRMEVELVQKPLNPVAQSAHASVRALRELGAGAIRQRAEEIVTSKYIPEFQAAASLGELRAGFPIEGMACQLTTTLSGALHDWAEDSVGFEEFRRHAIVGLAVVIIAAAEEPQRGRWEALLGSQIAGITSGAGGV